MDQNLIHWTIGFTDRYTVGVWVGNASGAPMWDVSGVTGAAPVWQAVIDKVQGDRPGAAPRAPASIARERVVFAPAIEPARDEVFVAGTAHARVVLPDAARRDRARVVTPADGTVIAPDPDIPLARQKLRVASAGEAASMRLDGRVVASNEAVPLPPAGAHLLTLHDAQGREVARARFVVRPLPTPAVRTALAR